MNLAICTTTINEPTEAILKFIEIAEKNKWTVVIAGDQKTPDDSYLALEKAHEFVFYLPYSMQHEKYPALSEAIGPNCIQRRNFAMLFAWEFGAEGIAVVDDDNIPKPGWGKDLMIGRELHIDTFVVEEPAFDPLSPFFPHLWHRGFPVQLLDKRTLLAPAKKKRKVLVQADMWDGAPDVDAVARIAFLPEVEFPSDMHPFAATAPGPFNSQNTFIHRDVMREYFLFPHIGRMDDIWAAYYVQAVHPDCVVYGPASVVQKRNEHDLVTDLEREMIGYRHTLDFIKACEVLREHDAFMWPQFMPEQSILAYNEYIKIIDSIKEG